MKSLISEETLELINKDIVSKLREQGKIEELKKIAICSGKSCASTLNQECLKVLEIDMGADYGTFYDNLKD